MSPAARSGSSLPHLARELMLKATVKAPFAVVRSTLIYGEGDPHNGYGPNRFRRLASAGQEIVLFGEGEERRDHVLVDDVANIATGEVYSFRDIAERVAAMAKPVVAVRGTPRQGEMPHGGYRPFDIAVCRRAFPDFPLYVARRRLEPGARRRAAKCMTPVHQWAVFSRLRSGARPKRR